MNQKQFDLDVVNLIRQNGYTIIGNIRNELLIDWWNCQANNRCIEQSAHVWLDNYFAECDLTKSFKEKLIVVYDEMLPHEILINLHSWFKKQSCNLNNIIIVVTTTMGAKFWFFQYTTLIGENSFQLIDAPWLSQMFTSRFASIPKINQSTINKTLKYYFSFYGGTGSNLERDFITSNVLTKSNLGYIDYLSGWHKVSTQADFENYAEVSTNFLHEDLIKKLLVIRNTVKFDTSHISANAPIKNENFDFQGFQFDIDNICFAQVIRESTSRAGFCCISEKTLRPFLHGQVPLPIGLNSIDHLKNLGFNLQFDIIDYDYQSHPVFFNRILGLLDQIDKLSTYKLSYLEDYILDNSEIFLYNFEYVRSGDIFKNIKKQFINDLNYEKNIS
jgi:hypothetical protein